MLALGSAGTAAALGLAARAPTRLPAARRAAAAASASRMPLTYAKPIVIPPASGRHEKSLIMLHGLGDSGHGWADLSYALAAALPTTRFVFPHAASIPITLNGGMRMPGWYDIASLDAINEREDAAGLAESRRYVEALVAAEAGAGGLPSTRDVAVAGFSQGGAVALLMLRSELPLGAVVGLSTYVPLRSQPPLASAANAATPVLMAHGAADEVVAHAHGAASAELLRAAGQPLEWRSYPGMGHTASDAELAHVREFLARAFA